MVPPLPPSPSPHQCPCWLLPGGPDFAPSFQKALLCPCHQVLSSPPFPPGDVCPRGHGGCPGPHLPGPYSSPSWSLAWSGAEEVAETPRTLGDYKPPLGSPRCGHFLGQALVPKCGIQGDEHTGSLGSGVLGRPRWPAASSLLSRRGRDGSQGGSEALGRGWARQDPGQLKNPAQEPGLLGRCQMHWGFPGVGGSWPGAGRGAQLGGGDSRCRGVSRTALELDRSGSLHTLGLLVSRAGKVA